MSRLTAANYERNALRLAVGAALLLHLGVVLWLVLPGSALSEGRYQPLAVMEFAVFDPEGGVPGGGDEDEVAATPEPAPAPAAEPEQAVPQEELKPVVAPEPVEPDPEPQVIESISEKAAPLPPPPPPKPPKAEPKPKVQPKPKPKPKAKPKPTADQATSGGATKAGLERSGGVAPGGGPGEGQGGQGGGIGRGNPNAFKAYTAAIQKKLNRNKKYPPSARANKAQGVVTVNFTVNRQGAVTSSRLVKSSGHPELDEEVMALLRRVSPFAPMPKEMTQSSINLTAPIQFSIR